MSRFKNIEEYSSRLIDIATEKQLMHTTSIGRNHEKLIFEDAEVVSFFNCSYLGLDTDARLIKAAKDAIDKWGISFCCARTRMSNSDLVQLEAELSVLFAAPVITFPSVTTTHQVVVPMIAEGLIGSGADSDISSKYIFYFDKMAHNSMQTLRPYLTTKGTVKTLPHNDLSELFSDLEKPEFANYKFVYFTDGVFSMGGVCNLEQMKTLYGNPRVTLYIDDAHGTSIYGKSGEGLVAESFNRDWPENVIVTFSLAKGFGCNGGGVIFPNKKQEWGVRKYGSAYSFSGPLDYSIVGAALESLKIHKTDELGKLQGILKSHVELFDKLMGYSGLTFSPIRMIKVGDESKTIALGEQLRKLGYFVSTVFYPVVPKGEGQLRVCITSKHQESQIKGLVSSVEQCLAEINAGLTKAA